RIAEIDGEELVALVAVGLEAPDVVDPQRARIAVAVHEHDRRHAGLGRRRLPSLLLLRLLLAERRHRPKCRRARQQVAPAHSPPSHAPMLAKHGGEGYARGMTICCYVESPVGRLALEADGEVLTGVRWASDGERTRDKP